MGEIQKFAIDSKANSVLQYTRNKFSCINIARLSVAVSRVGDVAAADTNDVPQHTDATNKQ